MVLIKNDPLLDDLKRLSTEHRIRKTSEYERVRAEVDAALSSDWLRVETLVIKAKAKDIPVSAIARAITPEPSTPNRLKVYEILKNAPERIEAERHIVEEANKVFSVFRWVWDYTIVQYDIGQSHKHLLQTFDGWNIKIDAVEHGKSKLTVDQLLRPPKWNKDRNRWEADNWNDLLQKERWVETPWIYGNTEMWLAQGDPGIPERQDIYTEEAGRHHWSPQDAKDRKRNESLTYWNELVEWLDENSNLDGTPRDANLPKVQAFAPADQLLLPSGVKAAPVVENPVGPIVGSVPSVVDSDDKDPSGGDPNFDWETFYDKQRSDSEMSKKKEVGF